MSDARFQLKTVPPRLGRAVLPRPRLEQRWTEVGDRTAIVVTTPQGFGKTTLLAQWRRHWLEQGAYVAWATLDAQDDRSRFVDLLFFALRATTGRDSFGSAAIQGQLESNRELDALTLLLAEVTSLATPVVIILDDVHRMPQAVLRELLAYLLNNAPPNLQFVIGTRRPLELDLSDLRAGGRLAAIDVGDLRLDLAEALELLRARFGNRIGLDDAVKLHGLVEGWPLGLQLAASTIEPASDLHEVIAHLSARRGDLQRFFFESLLSRLPPDESAFLVRISILENVNLDLCVAVTGCPETSRYLDRLAEESPVVTEGEGRDWMRLHAMARDFLLGQFDRLPADERSACHARAATWYADHGQFHEAARHALAAGDEDLAVEFAARCLFDIAREGRLAEANDWIKRLPASLLSRDVRLQLSAAWITALGSGAPTVPALLERIARHPQFDEECRLRAGLVAAAAAVFCDQPGLIVDALRAWDPQPAVVSSLDEVSLANCRAALALHAGDNEQARRLLLGVVAGAPRDAGMRLSLGFSDLLVGLSHVLEGNANRAVSVMQPKLVAAEREMGRRSTIAAMLAGALAAACMLRGDAGQALATLADRVDVIERIGMPDSTILAYRTLAAIAMRRGEEAHALEILVALHEFGVTRNLPRVLFVSLTEQVKLHAVQGRVETAAGLLGRLEALEPVFNRPAYQPFRWYFRRMRAVATACVRLAASDLEGARAALCAWLDTEPDLHHGALTLQARAMLALIAHEQGHPQARDRLAEILSLADLGGIRSYVEAAHPRLAGLIAAGENAGRDAAPRAGDRVHLAIASPLSGGLLTPKEARILSLLATGKANKEIARAMDIGEQTVKWHLKNLFFKLNAASRKHAVDRARLLGLVTG